MPLACTDLAWIRWTNAGALLFLPILCFFLLRATHRHMDTLTPLVCASLPPLYFFGFLYYTDVWSVVTILAALAAMEHRQHVLASLLGFVSLWFRQTNIVWVAFVMGAALVKDMQRLARVPSHITPPLLRLAQSWATYPALGRTAVIYLPTFVCFGAFMVWNHGTIVLGDQSHHQASLHLSHVNYFFAFALFFGAPVLVSHAYTRVSSRLVMLSIALGALSTLAVRYGTVVHPFLLADNRHYTFYVWRRIINRTSWSRYALVSIYTSSALLWYKALSVKQCTLWILGWCMATCLTLIPSPLMEPRYYLVPYMILRLYVPAPPKIWLYAEALWLVCINLGTIWVFGQHTFAWPQEAGLQRFMW